jgi:hypothetical protein
VKPYLKVSVTEVTEDANENRLIEPEYHVHAAINFDGKEEFDVCGIKICDVDSEPTQKELAKHLETITAFEERWSARAKAIKVKFIMDRESVSEFFANYETPMETA